MANEFGFVVPILFCVRQRGRKGGREANQANLKNESLSTRVRISSGLPLHMREFILTPIFCQIGTELKQLRVQSIFTHDFEKHFSQDGYGWEILRTAGMLIVIGVGRGEHGLIEYVRDNGVKILSIGPSRPNFLTEKCKNAHMARRRKGVKMRTNKKKKAVSEVSVEKKFFLALSDVADVLSPPPQPIHHRAGHQDPPGHNDKARRSRHPPHSLLHPPPDPPIQSQMKTARAT